MRVVTRFLSKPTERRRAKNEGEGRLPGGEELEELSESEGEEGRDEGDVIRDNRRLRWNRSKACRCISGRDHFVHWKRPTPENEREICSGLQGGENGEWRQVGVFFCVGKVGFRPRIRFGFFSPIKSDFRFRFGSCWK